MEICRGTCRVVDADLSRLPNRGWRGFQCCISKGNVKQQYRDIYIDTTEQRWLRLWSLICLLSVVSLHRNGTELNSFCFVVTHEEARAKNPNCRWATPTMLSYKLPVRTTWERSPWERYLDVRTKFNTEEAPASQFTERQCCGILMITPLNSQV